MCYIPIDLHLRSMSMNMKTNVTSMVKLVIGYLKLVRR
ncbi:hypothetical protein AALP_AA8G029300 [Arabis alpina]|uniref:Uncharacterized protein n=1 Tax=Arabis alpina TaxID=50452 RepID=A0A087G4L8_ARAAL|nr:hypothetical protein AALP_AA8G029300 [Arabis alpina]